MARLTASRTFALLKGGFFVFMMMLSFTFWLYGVTASSGTAFLSCSAAVFVVSPGKATRSEEHTSELQSRLHLVCRLLLEKKKNSTDITDHPPRLPHHLTETTNTWHPNAAQNPRPTPSR